MMPRWELSGDQACLRGRRGRVLPLFGRRFPGHLEAAVGHWFSDGRANGGGRRLQPRSAAMYEASINILVVGQERGITQTPSDVIGLQQLTQTMVGGEQSPCS